MSNEWTNPEHALAYLARADSIPHRTEGEAALLDELPAGALRILDLGSGDGRLLALVLLKCPGASGVALDFSPAMIRRLHERFTDPQRVQIVEHNMDHRLPALGCFDVICSSFAIHHLEHPRKRDLYTEIWTLLNPGGAFVNLEHVASPNDRVHRRFLEAIGVRPEEEDPSNKLLDVHTQLQWLSRIGFEDVDCYWKWRELALLVGRKPSASSAA
jgi:SAM-dependent methyltransferase